MQIFALVEHELTERKAEALLSADEGTPCSEERMRQFLDGLIVEKRGPRDPTLAPLVPERLTNNEILKKLRISFNMREEQLLATFAAGGNALTKTELSGLFRKRLNKHYRSCSDEVLQAFILGIAPGG